MRVKGWGVLGVDHWKAGKGKPPKGKWVGDTLFEAYLELWRQWVELNPALLNELAVRAQAHDGKLSDMFAHGRPVNQARALAYLLNNHKSE